MKNGYLTFKAADCSIDIHFPHFGTDVIDKIAGRKVVAAVYYYIILTDNFLCVFFRSQAWISPDSYLAV